MSGAVDAIRGALFSMEDLEYRAFHASLIPTIDPERIIGVRTPKLRAYARTLKGTELAEQFLRELPHDYYEENNLHAFLIEACRDYDQTVELLNQFLPYVDNWATCDSMSPRVFARHLPQLRQQCRVWLDSDQAFTIRFGIGMLMRYFLDDAFCVEYAEWVCAVRSDEYYVNMMVAWYFATALAKQYETVLPYFTSEKLAAWTHNKAIQKAVESRRITPEQKSYLKTLKR